MCITKKRENQKGDMVMVLAIDISELILASLVTLNA